MNPEVLAKLLDEQYTIPTIKDFIGDATRVRIDYVTIISVNTDTNVAEVSFLGGHTMKMRTGIITPWPGATFRARRINGEYQTDDLRRP